MIFIFPHDYFDHKIPEDYYQFEFDIVRKLGNETVLIDFDKMLAGSDPFSPVVEYEREVAVWRGWQMTSDAYFKFYSYAEAHGLKLINSAVEYATCHELSSSYPYMKDYSIDTVFMSSDEATAINIRAAMDKMDCDRLFVKDTVKGQRDFPCVIEITDTDDEIASKIAALIADRGDVFTGTLAFRRFIELSGETRFFVLDERVVATGEHFSEAADISEAEAAEAISALSGCSRFFTLDMARTFDGKAVVVETGDGQVSECPEHAAVDLIGALVKLDG